MDKQLACPADLGNAGATQLCQAAQQAATDAARAKVDEKMLCALYCCCATTGGKQACVEEALNDADRASGYASRYKAEVSYNMQTKPPRPMMVKKAGMLTTEPISRGNFGHLANRAAKEYDPGLQRPSGIGGYRWRRPDIVVVHDRSKPPTQDNIAQIIEMKFPPDKHNPSQIGEYRRIAGDSRKVRTFQGNGKPCKCPKPEPKGLPVTVKVPELSPSDIAILVGLGVLTVGLAAIPFDGPAGEIAAGTSFAAKFAQMFGRSAALAY